MSVRAAAMAYFHAYRQARDGFAHHASTRRVNLLEQAEIAAHAVLIEACAQNAAVDVDKAITGALRSTVDAHGNTVTGSWIGSATKRIRGSLESVGAPTLDW